MIGLEIGLGKLNKDNNYTITFGDLANLGAVEGLTNLANAFLFFILSSFNPDTQIGSNLLKRIRDGVLYKDNVEATVLEIHDDISDASNRFKAMQAKALNIDPSEKLKEARILNIDIDIAQGFITVDLNLINSLDQRVGVRV